MVKSRAYHLCQERRLDWLHCGLSIINSLSLPERYESSVNVRSKASNLVRERLCKLGTSKVFD